VLDAIHAQEKGIKDPMAHFLDKFKSKLDDKHKLKNYESPVMSIAEQFEAQAKFKAGLTTENPNQGNEPVKLTDVKADPSTVVFVKTEILAALGFQIPKPKDPKDDVIIDAKTKIEPTQDLKMLQQAADGKYNPKTADGIAQIMGLSNAITDALVDTGKNPALKWHAGGDPKVYAQKIHDNILKQLEAHENTKDGAMSEPLRAILANKATLEYLKVKNKDAHDAFKPKADKENEHNIDKVIAERVNSTWDKEWSNLDKDERDKISAAIKVKDGEKKSPAEISDDIKDAITKAMQNLMKDEKFLSLSDDKDRRNEIAKAVMIEVQGKLKPLLEHWRSPAIESIQYPRPAG